MTYRLLVVEDQPELRRAYVRYFADAFEIDAFATVEAALAHLDTHPAPDVIVSDRDLGPGLDGVAFFNHVGNERWAFVFVTGAPFGLPPEADAIVSKPCRLSELRALLCELAAQGSGR